MENRKFDYNNVITVWDIRFSSHTFDPNVCIHFRKCPIERIHWLTVNDIE